MLTSIKDTRALSAPRVRWFKRALRLEWLGQTVASVAWIASVFSYGISSPGDWLQLLAASAWLVTNIAALSPPTRAKHRE